MRKMGVATTLESGLIAKYILGDESANAYAAGCALTTEFINARPDVDRYRNWLAEPIGPDGKPAANGRPHVEVKVVERAYLGEFWNYLVAPVSGAIRMRVTTPPLDIYGVGDTVWLELDPRQMAPIV